MVVVKEIAFVAAKIVFGLLLAGTALTIAFGMFVAIAVSGQRDEPNSDAHGIGR